MRANRVVITKPGPPDALRYESYELAPPGPGDVLLRQTAIGLNYIDVQHRTGRYPLPQYPSPIGTEGAGVVETVGSGVREITPGDRVAYSSFPIGSYADFRLMPADRLVALPAAISDATAAVIMTKGLTAHYLLFTTFPVRKGQTILVHAAAGGVGLMLCQWAKHLGASVIGTVGTEEKAWTARAHGCDVAIVHGRQDLVDTVRRVTGGEGVPVVYDSIGKDTFEDSLRCLAPRGLLVSFGTPSGSIPHFDLFRLNALGSLYITSPAFVTHTKERSELLERATAVFAAVESGIVKVEIGRTYRLSDAVRAHEDLQARRTIGASILMP